jgi:4-diphosphocytidyl-2-C-methyl-D-erythritol kinase
MGAGLGGGSSDGAFTLFILNDLFRLGLTEAQLIHYALLLGSDCPFFIKNKPAFASSRGEILEPIELDLSAYKFVLIHPGTHVSTAEAFKAITPKTPVTSIKEIIQKPISSWKEILVNDFESGITQLLPEIGQIKSMLYEKGAIYAAMSGSGSAVYGIFEKNSSMDAHFPSHYAVFQTI